MPKAIYLDYNSTTPLLPEVRETLDACWALGPLNPSSQHRQGQIARSASDDATEGIAQLLGAVRSGSTPDRIILTSGGTEANNLAIFGLIGGRPTPGNSEPPGHLVISAIEHPSVSAAADHLAAHGWQVDRLGVDAQGVVRVGELPALLRPNTQLVSVMLGNNETGVLQPVADLARICHGANVPIHTDAAQVAGKVPIDIRDLGVDALSIAAHKFNGPLGIGALVVRASSPLTPDLLGGTQQDGERPGTIPVGLAVGMVLALRLWDTHQEDWSTRLESLRDRLEEGLRAGWPTVEILGSDAPRLPHTSNLSFVGLDRQALFIALDQAGVACSTGSACSSGASNLSPVHVAMGCSEEVASGALRFSLGVPTSESEVDEAIERILAVVKRIAS